MKLIYSISAMLLFFSFEGMSQCSSTVHQNSEVIDASAQRNSSQKKYWVCDGGALNLNGNQNQIWIERGGITSIIGDSNNIYVRETGTIVIAGDYNNLWYDANATVTDNGTFSTKNECNPAVFDYSVAPASGCEYWASVPDVTFVKDAKIYPNPAREELFVEFPDANSDQYRVEFFDLSGKLIHQETLTSNTTVLSIAVGNLAAGQYNLRVQSGNTLVNQLINIQH